jgi:hypothetical protein
VLTIPDPVWSGLIGALTGALVALITTLLNNRSQNARQAKQLESDVEQRTRQLRHDAEQRNLQMFHDSEQRKSQLAHDAEQRRLGFSHDSEQRRTERDMSLRREVYLTSAEAIGRLQEFIANSSRMDISDSDRLEIVNRASGILNKIHIVGSNETIEAFGAIQSCFARRAIKVEERRVAVALENQKRARLEGYLGKLSDRQAGISQILQGVVQEVGFDNPRINSHPLLLEFIDIGERIKQAQAELERLPDSIFGLQIDLVEEVRDGVLEIGEWFSSAILTVRRELGLHIEEERYKEQVAINNSRLRDQFESLITKYRGATSQAGEDNH